MRHAVTFSRQFNRQIIVIVAGFAVIVVIGCATTPEVGESSEFGGHRAQEALVMTDTSQALVTTVKNEPDFDHDHDHDDIVLSALLDSVVENESRSFITGRCLCRQVPQSATEFPCENVGILLEDELGKVVRRVNSVDGEFVFPAEKAKRYRLQVSSKRYLPLSAPEPTQLGDNVVLHLVEK